MTLMLKKWLARLLIVSLLLAVVGIVLCGAAASSWGQNQFRLRITEQLEKDYGITLRYSVLRMWPGSAGMVVVLHDLRWGYRPLPRTLNRALLSKPIDRVKISFNPFRFASGVQAITEIKIEGAELGLSLINNRLTIEGLQNDFDPKAVDDLITRIKAIPRSTREWPRIVIKDLILNLKVNNAANRLFLQARTTRQKSIESFRIMSPSFEHR
ncbi:MAG: hypothetical protein H7249_04160 [Chitinophagaceae bacterium]|nr:hypothetical protein [Oligoflexus sp.]